MTGPCPYVFESRRVCCLGLGHRGAHTQGSRRLAGLTVAAKPKPQPPKDRCVARLSYPDGRQCRGDAVGDTPWCPMHTRQVDESRRRQGAVQGGRMYVEEERELEGLSRVGPPTEETPA